MICIRQIFDLQLQILDHVFVTLITDYQSYNRTDQSAEDSFIKTMLPFHRKNITDVSVILVALFMWKLSFKAAGPLLVVDGGTQPTQHFPTPHKSSNVQSLGGDGLSGPHHNSLLVLANPKPNPHLPTPSHHRNVHYSVEASAAGELSSIIPQENDHLGACSSGFPTYVDVVV